MTDRERPDVSHTRPDGVTDSTVAAVGKLSEALETVERARGHLYGFHQLMGHADLQVEQATEMLRKAGHSELAARVERELIGRNVTEGRWTFQVVEEFDDGYWAELRALDAACPRFGGAQRAGRGSPTSVRGRIEGGASHPRAAWARGPARAGRIDAAKM